MLILGTFDKLKGRRPFGLDFGIIISAVLVAFCVLNSVNNYLINNISVFLKFILFLGEYICWNKY